MDRINLAGVIPRLRGMRLNPAPPGSPPSIPTATTNSDSSTAGAHASDKESSQYKPTPIDVVVVHIMLSRGRKLPPDIVQLLLDHAEYWAHSSNEIDFQKEYGHPLRVTGSSREETKFLLRSYPVGLTSVDQGKTLAEELSYDTKASRPQPLTKEHDPDHFIKFADYPTPLLASPVRKVVFTLQSHDQGTVSRPGVEGTYETSWTWFEAGLERFQADQECGEQCVPDVRHESPGSTAPKLPLCALRPVYPSIDPLPDNPGEFKYHEKIGAEDTRLVQKNKIADRSWNDYEITWSYLDNTPYEGESEATAETSSPETDKLHQQGRGRGTATGAFVRDLKMGDVVTLWGMARFPVWANVIKKVRMEVYWAI